MVVLISTSTCTDSYDPNLTPDLDSEICVVGQEHGAVRRLEFQVFVKMTGSGQAR